MKRHFFLGFLFGLTLICPLQLLADDKKPVAKDSLTTVSSQNDEKPIADSLATAEVAFKGNSPYLAGQFTENSILFAAPVTTSGGGGVFKGYGVQPEVWRPTKYANNDGVNSDGDFNLKEDVIAVKGLNNLDYPVSFEYSSRITQHQPSTWVGYGWSFDPGSITREGVVGYELSIDGAKNEYVKRFNSVDFAQKRNAYQDNFFVTLPGNKFSFNRKPNYNLEEVADFHNNLKSLICPNVSNCATEINESFDFLINSDDNFRIQTDSTYFFFNQIASLSKDTATIETLNSLKPIFPANGAVSFGIGERSSGAFWESSNKVTNLPVFGFDVGSKRDYKNFILTNSSGVKFVFGLPLLETADFTTPELNRSTLREYYISNWRLTAILGQDYIPSSQGKLIPDSTDFGSWVKLNYQDKDGCVYQPIGVLADGKHKTCPFDDTEVPEVEYGGSRATISKFRQTAYLASIETPIETAYFNLTDECTQSYARLDECRGDEYFNDQIGFNRAKRRRWLKDIVIKSRSTGSKNLVEINTGTINVFSHHTNNNYDLTYPHQFIAWTPAKRALKSIKYKSESGVLLNEKSYGYYDNKIDIRYVEAVNSALGFDLGHLFTDLSVNTAARYPFENIAWDGKLKTIGNSTGAKTLIEYEPDRYACGNSHPLYYTYGCKFPEHLILPNTPLADYFSAQINGEMLVASIRVKAISTFSGREGEYPFQRKFEYGSGWQQGLGAWSFDKKIVNGVLQRASFNSIAIVRPILEPFLLFDSNRISSQIAYEWVKETSSDGSSITKYYSNPGSHSAVKFDSFSYHCPNLQNKPLEYYSNGYTIKLDNLEFGCSVVRGNEYINWGILYKEIASTKNGEVVKTKVYDYDWNPELGLIYVEKLPSLAVIQYNRIDINSYPTGSTYNEIRRLGLKRMRLLGVDESTEYNSSIPTLHGQAGRLTKRTNITYTKIGQVKSTEVFGSGIPHTFTIKQYGYETDSKNDFISNNVFDAVVREDVYEVIGGNNTSYTKKK